MTDVPFFTVITPVRNGARHVDGYVRTLVSQTYQEWEAIMVDDQSEDDTLRLLETVAAADSRFRIFSCTLPKKIGGPYQARNLGLDRATGRYICFLDIDDRWLPNKLFWQKQALIRSPGIVLLYSAYYRARGASVCLATVRQVPPPIMAALWLRVANPVPMLTACVQSSIVRGIRFKPVNHEDYIFWHEVFGIVAPRQISCSNVPSAIYSVDPRSLSGNKARAVVWIWNCYRIFGYSPLNASLSLCLRGLLQLGLTVSDIFFGFLLRIRGKWSSSP